MLHWIRATNVHIHVRDVARTLSPRGFQSESKPRCRFHEGDEASEREGRGGGADRVIENGSTVFRHPETGRRQAPGYRDRNREYYAEIAFPRAAKPLVTY